jgi:hypothetical protein
MPRHKAGFLFKKGHVRKNWKKRYFVLDGVQLSYYVRIDGQRKGAIDLSSEGVLVRGALQIRGNDVSRFQFEIVHNNSTLVIAAEDQKQMNDWIEALNIAVWTAQMGSEGDDSAASLPGGLPGVTDDESRGLTRAASVENALVAARGAPPPLAIALETAPQREDLGGWERLTDGDGNDYFYNHVSKVSSRQHPSMHASEAGPPPGAPPGQEDSMADWEEHEDADGNKYYYNIKTHVSSRQHPSTYDSGDSPAEEEAAPMHAEWEPSKGQYFFQAPADEPLDADGGDKDSTPEGAEVDAGAEQTAVGVETVEAKPKRKTMMKRSSLKVLVDSMVQKNLVEGNGAEEDDEELLLQLRHKERSASISSLSFEQQQQSEAVLIQAIVRGHAARKGNKKRLKKAKHRVRVVKELLSTEVTYNEGIGKLVEVAIAPLKWQCRHSKNNVMTMEEINSIFSNMEQVS